MKLYYAKAPYDRAAFVEAVFRAEKCDPFPLTRTRSGKPYLNFADAPKFSLTHTRGLIAMAIGTCEMGLDAEDRTRDVPPSLFRRLTDAEKQEDFFTLWTAKEAYAKLLGVPVLRLLPSLVYENGTLLQDGKPVSAVPFRILIGTFTLCLYTEKEVGEVPICSIPS